MKRIQRIGLPAPERAPVVVQRLGDKTLCGMSEQELSDHLFEISGLTAEVSEYVQHVQDRMVIQHDIEAVEVREILQSIGRA